MAHSWNVFGEVKTGWRMLLRWIQSYMTIRDILRFPIGSAIIQVVASTLRSSPKQVNPVVALPPQCCSLGLSHGWRTGTFQAPEHMSEPFFFDSSGSFYAQTFPPLLIVQATEQSLVPTSQVNRPSVIFLSSSTISMGSLIVVNKRNSRTVLRTTNRSEPILCFLFIVNGKWSIRTRRFHTSVRVADQELLDSKGKLSVSQFTRPVLRDQSAANSIAIFILFTDDSSKWTVPGLFSAMPTIHSCFHHYAQASTTAVEWLSIHEHRWEFHSHRCSIPTYFRRTCSQSDIGNWNHLRAYNYRSASSRPMESIADSGFREENLHLTSWTRCVDCRTSLGSLFVKRYRSTSWSTGVGLHTTDCSSSACWGRSFRCVLGELGR